MANRVIFVMLHFTFLFFKMLFTASAIKANKPESFWYHYRHSAAESLFPLLLTQPQFLFAILTVFFFLRNVLIYTDYLICAHLIYFFCIISMYQPCPGSEVLNVFSLVLISWHKLNSQSNYQVNGKFSMTHGSALSTAACQPTICVEHAHGVYRMK